jgi:hypothetical protein
MVLEPVSESVIDNVGPLAEAVLSEVSAKLSKSANRAKYIFTLFKFSPMHYFSAMSILIFLRLRSTRIEKSFEKG